MDPFGAGQEGRQAEYDARRVHYLECVVVDAVLKSDRWGRWAAGRTDVTVCDAVAELGLHALDPGLRAVHERLAALAPEERDAFMAKRLSSEERLVSTARALLARADETRRIELFGRWYDPIGYWGRIGDSEHMRLLIDTADFGANELLRVLYLLGETPAHLLGAAADWRDPSALGRDPCFPAEAEERLRSQFLEFKYWLDDPFDCGEFGEPMKKARRENTHEKMESGRDMTYWSENHRLLFATAEYLAGQLWPDEAFVSMRAHRNPPGPRPEDMDGAGHMAHARPRLLAWLNERLRLGYAEWNAPGYYKEDVIPLINLVDFAVDEEIRTRAAMALDLLVFDLARSTLGGAFAGAAGRAYFEHKNCVWEQSVRDPVEILFGTRGHFVGAGNPAIALATSPRYRPPDALLAIGTDPPPRSTTVARVSIDFEEAGEHGVGFESEDDVVFWWSRGAYVTKWTVQGSLQVAEHRHLMETPPFREVLKPVKGIAGVGSALRSPLALGAGAGASLLLAMTGAGTAALAPATFEALAGLLAPDEEDLADTFSVLTEGSSLTRANLQTYRTKAAMLSSVRDFRPGQLNFQGVPCVATVGGAMVWTSYPSAGTSIKEHVSLAPARGGLGALLGGSALGPVGAVAGYLLAAPSSSPVGDLGVKDFDVDETPWPAHHDGPNWWTGNAVQPRVVQARGAALIAYRAQTIQKLMFGARTHAWFPRNQFEETAGPEPVGAGVWFFGRAGDGYVGLFSARPAQWTRSGQWKDKEIQAAGATNVFVLQVGDAAEFGSFAEFCRRVRAAALKVSDLDDEPVCRYDIPGGARLQLDYEEPGHRYAGTAAGREAHPRFLGPFARVAWQQDRYAIHHRGHALVHDVVAGKRRLTTRLRGLVHDTPLTVYSQNMGLLPGAEPLPLSLYRGLDRRGALAHLVAILRARRPDVVGLSEMWVGAEREELRERLADLYPHTLEGPTEDDLGLPLVDLEIMSGGLMLLSRHPFVSTHQTIYRQCSGDDCATNKGILHAAVQRRGSPCAVDVFLTHTQAPEPTVGGSVAGARRAVEAQLRHLGAFVAASRTRNRPALLLGDLNVDSFAHSDLYLQLTAALGDAVDLEPSIPDGARWSRPTATSESDHGTISAFHADHHPRLPDDSERFGVQPDKEAERLDYMFLFPGLLYTPHVAASQVRVEQWKPERDLSDHYGLEAHIDTTLQTLPEEEAIERVRVVLESLRCLRATSGPGDDEVALTVSAYADSGETAQVRAGADELDDGVERRLDNAALVLRDPGDSLLLTLSGRELDDLSADDSLGTVALELRRDELLALCQRGPTRTAFPLLTGDGAEYALWIRLEVS